MSQNYYLTKIQEEFAQLHADGLKKANCKKIPLYGCVLNGELMEMPKPDLTLRDPVNFVMKKDGAVASKFVKTGLVDYEEKTFRYYATPRAGNPHACKSLTKRSQNDLASQLRYDKVYVEKYPDPADRGMVVHPRFGEYMQGFPRDWTDPEVAMVNPLKVYPHPRLKAIDLFSGIGGLTLAADKFLESVAYCDIDADARAVLNARMKDGSIDTAPIYEDIKKLDATKIEADVVIGGFPCQDLSTMGKRKGFEGQKSVLFYEAMRIAKECNAKAIILENVKGLLNCGGNEVFFQIRDELSSNGYDYKYVVVEAAHAGAVHHRARVFFLALRRDLIPKDIELGLRTPLDTKHNPFWTEQPIPAVEERMVMKGNKKADARMKQIGNVVCPLQGELAMRVLIPSL